MESLGGVCRVLYIFLYVTLVNSSHVVFTSSASIIKPLVTYDLTLRCHLRDGQTTAVIGKRHAVSEVNSQGQVESGVIPRSQDIKDREDFINDVIRRDEKNEDALYRDAQPSDVSFVHSVIITKDGADVATVTDYITATALDKTPDINVTGHIPGSGTEKGFLEVTWKYPGPHQRGIYTCTVTGTDKLGHVKTFSESVEITDQVASMTDVIDLIQQLKISNDLYKTTIGLHTTTIASLQQSNDIQTSTIANQSLAILDMENEITELKQKQNTAVMFTAYLDHAVRVPSGAVVVFNQVTTNVGQNYDPATGVFTCPVSGYYVFDVHIQGQSDQRAAVKIFVNGSKMLAYGYADDQLDNQSVSAYGTAVLQQGDKVDVKTDGTSPLYSTSSRHECTFSGHLVSLLK